MLTPDLAALLPNYRGRWNAYRRATAACDRTAAEAGIHIAYRAAGLAPPGRIEWRGSPIEMVREWEQGRLSASSGPNVRAALVERVHDKAAAAVQARMDRRVRELIFEGAGAAPLDAAISLAVVTAVVRHFQDVRPPMWARVRRWMRALASREKSLRLWPAPDECCIIQHELGWLAAFEYLHDVLALQRETEILGGLWLIGSNAGWIRPHAHVCWVGERHNVLNFDARGRLHCSNGPALGFPDGWTYYAWKGVEVPGEFIKRPELINLDDIDSQHDIFVRHSMIEIITPRRFVAMGGATFVSRDLAGVLWSRTWHNGDFWAAVEVVNGTAAPDGSRQSYFLQVPPGLRTARAAVAWTYGISEQQYLGLVQRT